MPLIVTDPDGDDPMVILPLEQFEALSQDEDFEGDFDDRGFIGSDEEMAFDFTPEDGMERGLPEGMEGEEGIEIEELPSVPAMERTDAPLEDAEAPIEEQFFMEPMDDEENG